MMKDNYVLFIAYVTNDKIYFIKMYPEGESKMIFLKRGHGIILSWYKKRTLLWKDLNIIYFLK